MQSMDTLNSPLVFYVNEKKVTEHYPCPKTTLLQYLRHTLNLTGTKNACNQGGCGACTVMLSWWDKQEQCMKHANVNACLVLICQIHGFVVTTIEDVGNTQKGLHPVQTNIVDSFGMQCGFCTPGMVMTMYTLLQTNHSPSEETLEKTLKECPRKGKLKDIEDLCQNKGNTLKKGTQDASDGQKVTFQCGDWTWVKPLILKDVVDILDTHPESHLVSGATNLVSRLQYMDKGTLISCSHVQEMTLFHPSEDSVEIGAALTLTEITRKLKDFASKLTENDCCGHELTAILESMESIACPQIRNQATLGGHIAAGDSRSDLCVVLMSISAKATLASKAGTRKVTLDNNFFNRKSEAALRRSEVLVSVHIPFVKKAYTVYYKQAHRKGFDYAILNCCFTAIIGDNKMIDNLNLCFGSVFATTKRLDSASDLAIGRYTDMETLRTVCDEIVREMSDQPMGSITKYQQKLACGFVFKYWRALQASLGDKDSSQINGIGRMPCFGIQLYETPSTNQPVWDGVGRPVPLVSAPALVSGEAMFFDDMPKFQNELYIEMLLSTKPHAWIVSIDTTTALAAQGVVDFIDCSSVPGQNRWGIDVHDEPLFAEQEVHCVGQPIGAILATSKQSAKAAVDLIKITYEELPCILTIEDAIKAESYFDYNSPPIQCGNPEDHFEKCDVVTEGQVRSGYQEHLYFEPSGALVVPKNESGDIEIFTTAQAPTFCQVSASRLLGIPQNRVVVRQKRLGGGFGGKESRTPLMFGAAAVAAFKWKKPVRMVMDRAVDFQITGKRHPFLFKYKVGFRQNGGLEALSIHFYIDAGHTLDVSSRVLKTACLNGDAAYKIPQISLHGHICKTNTPSNTAMRGFGAVEAAFVMENILSTVAETLEMDQETVREMNMYREGSLTHYNIKLEGCMLQKCWSDCLEMSDFCERKTDVQTYNRKNRYKKKGIAVMPVKFRIGYPLRHKNQGAALVNVYLDGSVRIAIGGVEMGQGLNTKMTQVASRALGLSMENIYISEVGTNTVPNTISTAASLSSDLNGAAILDACAKIRKRLEPFKNKDSEGTWTSWVNAAFLQRVSLSATGIGRPGYVDGPVHYYTYGAACTEVEIDCITGDHQVVRTDIVMDVGNSLNPALDVGQIEGAFVQGYGWVTMEELKISQTGKFEASGPVEYKIPGVRNIPRQMRVKILKNCPNKGTIYSSKGIGEPPLLLSISVFIALKEAIRSARKDAALDGGFNLDIPLTPEKIRMACPLTVP